MENKNNGIFNDGDCFWNADETKLDSEFEQRVKVFGRSTMHHGGFISSSEAGRSWKHLTPVLVASASEPTVPPFFIFEGTNIISVCLGALNDSMYRYRNGQHH